MSSFNTDNAAQFLRQSLCNCLKSASVDNEKVVLNDMNISITPIIDNLEKNIAVISYYISIPEFDTVIHECAVGVSEDQKTAVGMSQDSFMFGVMNTVEMMMTDRGGCDLKTEFAGHEHEWKVYIGNIVGMGKNPQNQANDIYWNVLKDSIAERIGNQKLCCIKIFGSNSGNGDVTCECRINNVKSEELSNIIADMIKQWNISEFGSHKQFIIIKQDSGTTMDYPFTEKEIADKTEIAMKLFESCETDEDYENFPKKLEEAVGDKSLACELRAFIPEICAQNVFDLAEYPESMMMDINGETKMFYNTQLASYYTIVRSVFSVLDKGVLKDTNKVYNDYIRKSSLAKVMYEAQKNGSKLEDLSAPCIMYIMDDGYVVR